MIIEINSRREGWGDYVINGTKDNPRDKSKIELLDGDISLGDELSKNSGYYTIVLGFKGKPSDEVIKMAYNDFKKQFFIGYNHDELHIDSVMHKDTDNYHIHLRVPKQNLLTGNQIQLYYDKIDRKRKELIQDSISLKYDFEIARESNRQIIPIDKHKHINKWRDNFNQKPFKFDRKKSRAEAESQVNAYLVDLITSGVIDSIDDIEQTLEDLDLTVEKFGTDQNKDFSYVTVSNSSGKMRIKGDIYGGKFWQHSPEDRISQISSNRRNYADGRDNNQRLREVQIKLQKANESRKVKLKKLFASARNRAKKEHDLLYQQQQQKYRSSLIFDQWRNDSNFNHNWNYNWTNGIFANSTKEVSGIETAPVKSGVDSTTQFKSTRQYNLQKLHKIKQSNYPLKGDKLHDIKGELEDDSIRAEINKFIKRGATAKTKGYGDFSKIIEFNSQSATADFRDITSTSKTGSDISEDGGFIYRITERISKFISTVKSGFDRRVKGLVESISINECSFDMDY